MEDKLNYQKKMDYSYSLGSFPTFELCEKKPEVVRVIYLHPQANDSIKSKITHIAAREKIEIIEDEKFFKSLSKDNIFLAAKFSKYKSCLEEKNHLILHQPEQLGNLGTIFRSALAFGIEDIAIIDPSCDSFHPSTIRASMGAFFSLRTENFNSIEDYQKRFDNKIYAFMTGDHPHLKETSLASPYSLLFGSESSGLPQDYEKRFKPIKIKMSPQVDSLNLSLAVAIALHHLY